jgi:general stress protein 26
MNHTENLNNKEAVDKLKSLIDDIMVCIFCTHLKTDDGATARPMSAVKVCDQGNIWFFSEKSSEKNKDIATDTQVQLFFSHPGKSRYLIVNGEAEITFDKNKIEELWTPAVEIWFEEGKEDPEISIIKVKPTSAYYWDTDDNRMINLLKMAASVATGNNFISSKEGAIKV